VKIIEVDDETYAELARLGELIRTQDNQITAEPVFEVQDRPTRWQYCVKAACFTEDGAQRVIAAQRHNLNDPRVYVASGRLNPEWVFLRRFLAGVKA